MADDGRSSDLCKETGLASKGKENLSDFPRCFVRPIIPGAMLYQKGGGACLEGGGNEKEKT